MMNDIQIHLSDKQLDQQRAGLRIAPQLEAHLSQCPSCQKRANAWDRITARLNDRIPNEIMQRLRAHRRSILSVSVTRTRRRVAPIMATAAVIAMVVGIGLYTPLQPLNPLPNSANNMTTNAELFTEIDFYVWLGQQKNGALQTGSET